MDDIRKKVLDENVPVATVARLYKDTLFPVPENEKKDKDKSAIKSTANKLRDLVAPGKLASVMSAHNPLSARLAELAGFDGIWASGVELSGGTRVALAHPVGEVSGTSRGRVRPCPPCRGGSRAWRG